MQGLRRHIRGGRAGLALGLAALMTLTSCARHTEDAARALVSQWFELGETLYFESKSKCTAAVYRVRTGDVKSRVPLFASVDAVSANGQQDRAFALTVPDTSADALFIQLMNADRPTGVAIQAAGIEARNCMTEKARNTFYAALTVQPSVLVFSPGDGAFAVLDPLRHLVVLTSGDM